MGTVINYSPATKRFSKLVGLYQEQHIRNFMARVVKKKIQSRNIGSALTFEDKDCAKYHEDLKAKLSGESESYNDEDDEIIKQILEEERLEREERERKAKAKKNKKRRKKKKGKKKKKKQDL